MESPRKKKKQTKKHRVRHNNYLRANDLYPPNVQPGDKTYTCNICFSEYHLLSDLKKHISRKHEPKLFKCSVCFQRFTYQDGLKCHMKMHSVVKAYVCEVCKERFPNKMLKQQHYSKVHRRPIQCHICNAEYKNKGQLKKHLIKCSKYNVKNECDEENKVSDVKTECEEDKPSVSEKECHEEKSYDVKKE